MIRKLCLAFVVLLVPVAAGAPASAQTGSAKVSKSRGKARPSGKSSKAAKPSVSSFETRRADWIRRKEAANASGAAGPDPLEQYLVSEVIVTGLFETDSGFGVFLHATPTGNTFFATNGAKLFNGRLVSIEKRTGGFADDAQIVFEELGTKRGAQRIVKRVVPVPSKVEQAEPPPPPPAEKPAEATRDRKPDEEKPPVQLH